MRRYVLGVAVIAGLSLSALSLSVLAQAPGKGKDADKAKKDAERAAQGYNPVGIIDQAEVRAIRVELKPNANRAIHQHDDVKSHLFIPLSPKLQVTIGSAKPVDAPVGQVFYITRGTPHGFRNLSSEPGAAIEVFVK
jgi:quercetin dioxygenase-like cupin family protein